MVNQNKNKEKMKEKEIKEKIEGLQKQLRRKKEKNVVVEESMLSAVLYCLIAIILILFFDNILAFYNPSATILSIIGSLTIVLGLSWFFMVIIKSFLIKKKKWKY